MRLVTIIDWKLITILAKEFFMPNTQNGQGNGKSERGFAAMDEQKQREIASMGGKAAHESGNAHEFDSEEAAEAGRKGGLSAHASGNAHEFDSEEAREAGRKGGKARQQ
jgi:general stress protein YciG